MKKLREYAGPGICAVPLLWLLYDFITNSIRRHRPLGVTLVWVALCLIGAGIGFGSNRIKNPSVKSALRGLAAALIMGFGDVEETWSRGEALHVDTVLILMPLIFIVATALDRFLQMGDSVAKENQLR